MHRSLATPPRGEGVMPVRRAGGEHGAPQEFWDVVERLFRDRTGHAGLRPLQRLTIEQVFPHRGGFLAVGPTGSGKSGAVYLVGVFSLLRRGAGLLRGAVPTRGRRQRCVVCARKCLEVQPAGGSARWRQRSML